MDSPSIHQGLRSRYFRLLFNTPFEHAKTTPNPRWEKASPHLPLLPGNNFNKPIATQAPSSSSSSDSGHQCPHIVEWSQTTKCVFSFAKVLLSLPAFFAMPGQFEWSATNLVSHERTPILQSLAFEKSLAHENHDLDAEENGLWVPISPLTGTKRCLAVRTCWFVQATSYEMSHERWFVGWESSVRWTAFVSALLFIQNRLFLTHEYVFWMPSCYRCWNNQFLWCCWQLCIRSPRWTQKLGKSYSN